MPNLGTVVHEHTYGEAPEKSGPALQGHSSNTGWSGTYDYFVIRSYKPWIYIVQFPRYKKQIIPNPVFNAPDDELTVRIL